MGSIGPEVPRLVRGVLPAADGLSKFGRIHRL
jgi:hypothetical protein